MTTPAERTLQDEPTRRLLLPGQRVFGRFTLERIVGRGGMGLVWKARDQALEKDVALKFILETHAQNSDAVLALKRETRRCQELRHPGIVAIYDLHQEEDCLAVSMEYVMGETLAALKAVQEKGCFDPAEILPWLEQLTVALTYAHDDARVVHRDLKPGNLILTPSGRLKVMDFGISQPPSETLVGTAQRGNDGVTPPYGSPQQLMGEAARIADDVYSLGATIYDLLTGRPPFFRGQIDLQVLQVVPPTMTARRAELEHTGSEIPESWERVIAACLAKAPQHRPERIGEVLAALQGAREIEAAPDSVLIPTMPLPTEETSAPPVKIVIPRTEHPPTTRPPGEAKASASAFPPPLAPPADTAFVSLEPGPIVRPAAKKTESDREPDFFSLRALAIILALALLTASVLHWVRKSWAPVHPEPVATTIPEAGTNNNAAVRNPLAPPGRPARPGEKALDQPPRRSGQPPR